MRHLADEFLREKKREAKIDGWMKIITIDVIERLFSTDFQGRRRLFIGCSHENLSLIFIEYLFLSCPIPSSASVSVVNSDSLLNIDHSYSYSNKNESLDVEF